MGDVDGSQVIAYMPDRNDYGEDYYFDEEPPPEDEAAPPARRKVTLLEQSLSRSALKNLPSPAPLIDKTLDLGTVGVLAGYWGTGKSFIALDWAACIATGSSWQGRAVEQRRVMYIAAEGAHGLDDRLSAWEYTWGRRKAIADDQITVLPVRVNLLDWPQVYELCDLVKAGGYGFVIVDTLAKCLVGADENSAQDVGKAVDALYRIRDATGDGTVFAVHHTGKDKTTIRGSSALEAGVDAVYLTEGDESLITLSRTKRKDGPRPDVHQLAIKPVDEANSAVILSVRGADIAPKARDLLSVFMSGFSSTGASKAELRLAAEMPPATFARSLNSLVNEGLLTNHGTEQRPFYKAPDAE